MEYTLCESGHCCIQQKMFLEMKGIALHTKCAIIIIERQSTLMSVKTLVVYKNIFVSIEFGPKDSGGRPTQFFAKPNQKVSITTPHDECEMRVTVCKTRTAHTPTFISLRDPFDTMEVGMMLWFFCLEKYNSLAFYQNKKTGELYCCSKGCNRSFRTIEAWKGHFSFHVNIPGKFSMAILQDGKITHHPTATLRLRGENTQIIEDQPETIQKIILKHSWAWKSLSDTVYGKKLTSELEHKLHTVFKRRRIE